MTTILVIISIWLVLNVAVAAALYLKPLARRRAPKFVRLIDHWT